MTVYMVRTKSGNPPEDLNHSGQLAIFETSRDAMDFIQFLEEEVEDLTDYYIQKKELI